MSKISVAYDYDSDRITVTPSCYYCGLEATEQACGEVINNIREKALVFDGKPGLPHGSMFNPFFEQAGYSITGAPKELRQQIDKMFVVSVFFLQNAAPGAKPGDKPGFKPISKVIQCEAPLLGTGYSVKHP